MNRDLIEALVPLAVLVGGIVGARAWMARTAHLDLGLFRPYRGDPWPRGVQEDDDVRFNWTPARRDDGPGSVAVEGVDSIVVRRAGH
jgi:hypothetical protein